MLLAYNCMTQFLTLCTNKQRDDLLHKQAVIREFVNCFMSKLVHKITHKAAGDTCFMYNRTFVNCSQMFVNLVETILAKYVPPHMHILLPTISSSLIRVTDDHIYGFTHGLQLELY